MVKFYVDGKKVPNYDELVAELRAAMYDPQRPVGQIVGQKALGQDMGRVQLEDGSRITTGCRRIVTVFNIEKAYTV